MAGIRYGRPEEGVDPELKEIPAQRKICLKRCGERERRVNRLWEGRKGDLVLTSQAMNLFLVSGV